MTHSRKFLFGIGLAMASGVGALDTSTGSAGFQWKWTNNMVSTEITQCESYGVSVVSLPSNSSSFGTPPYYMIAWKAGGIPTVSYIGSDRDNLTWTVNQASGSSLILTVADSEGKAGGEAASLYNVTDGDSSCLPSAPSTNITLVANLSTSDPLETCEPLGLRVYGGQKPYTISLSAINSPVITNITLNQNDDVLTWPNLADPNGQLMASVSDANGTWGTSTGIFKTAGPAVTNQTRCSIVTNSGNSSNIDQHPPQPSGSNHTAVIAGVVVPVVVLSLAGLAFFLWRRRRLQKAREPEPAFLPDAWMGPSNIEAGAGGTYSPYDPPPSSKLARYHEELSSHTRTSSGNLVGMNFLSPGSSSTPQQAASAAGSRSHDGSFIIGKGGQRLPPGVNPEWTVEPDIIIQHRDGGIVQEIPPPYPSDLVQQGPPTAPPVGAAPPAPTGLSVAESTVDASSRPSSSGGRPTSSGGPPTSSGGPPTSTSSAAPLNPAPTESKGKGREVDLLT